MEIKTPERLFNSHGLSCGQLRDLQDRGLRGKYSPCCHKQIVTCGIDDRATECSDEICDLNMCPKCKGHILNYVPSDDIKEICNISVVTLSTMDKLIGYIEAEAESREAKDIMLNLLYQIIKEIKQKTKKDCIEIINKHCDTTHEVDGLAIEIEIIKSKIEDKYND